MNWQLSKIQYPVYNLGPGRRIGIWVQGCSLGCAGCVNQTLWNKKKGKSIGVLDVFNWLVSLEGEFDGITVSGGEPFEQYEQLIAFLHLVKTKTRLDTFCFSGYYLDELNEKFPDRLFCRYLDFLIDGRYVADAHENKNVKGSANQTFYQFIDGVPVKQNDYVSANKWSLYVDEDSQIHMAGVPKRNELEYISAQLSSAGIDKSFK
jgi:anaerobic ribonucleoside-triphosphate reductase activating protein